MMMRLHRASGHTSYQLREPLQTSTTTRSPLLGCDVRKTSMSCVPRGSTSSSNTASIDGIPSFSQLLSMRVSARTCLSMPQRWRWKRQEAERTSLG